MHCQEFSQLDEERKLHQEAELYLRAGKAAAYKYVIRICRADRLRASRAIMLHKSNCGVCSFIPHS